MSQLFTSGGQNYWSFILTISPSSEYSELIFFRIDWFDLLAVQGYSLLLSMHKNKQNHRRAYKIMGWLKGFFGILYDVMEKNQIEHLGQPTTSCFFFLRCYGMFVKSLYYGTSLSGIKMLDLPFTV